VVENSNSEYTFNNQILNPCKTNESFNENLKRQLMANKITRFYVAEKGDWVLEDDPEEP